MHDENLSIDVNDDAHDLVLLPKAGIIFGPADRAITKLPSTFS